MSRTLGLALCIVLVAAQASAQPASDATPEQLLPPTSQLYVRWDGITAHAETYQKSFWGPLMAGPTGDNVRELIAKLPKLFGNELLAEPLLDGKPPSELKATLADIKHASKLIDLVADKGIAVGAEIREPKPTLKGLGATIQGLVGGKLPGLEALLPDVHAVVIIPNVGEQSEVLFGTLRLVFNNDKEITPFTIEGRKGFRISLTGFGSPRPPVRALKAAAGEAEIVQEERPQSPFEFQAAWWMEGKHFVLYLGTTKPDAMVAEVIGNAKAGGVTANPHFARCQQAQKFTSVARGFIDAGKVVSLAKSLLGPFVPGLNARIDELGIGGFKALTINCGYAGREFRAVWELELAGQRQGLTKVLKGSSPIGLTDLPPMPADVSRFLAMRVDPEGAYHAGLGLIEALTMTETFGVEDDAKTAVERIRVRRDYLAREFDKLIGVSVKDEILPCLGDKVVIYQSPNEGLSVFGTVVCVSLKDAEKAKAAADRVHRGLENVISAPVKVRKKMLRGVEIRELYSRGFGIFVPTYAVVDDWLVVSLYPQGVQGMILRVKGDLAAWKPDADTLARLATLPRDGCTLQYCDPTTTAKNLCCLGPLFLGTVTGFSNSFGDREQDYDPIDLGLVPNAHELSKHLFANLTVIRDDGKTVRLEVNESISVPLEIIGLEPLIFGATIFGLRF